MFAEWQVGQMLWSVLWFTLFFLWIWLVIRVFVDIFRSHDMGGLVKVIWMIFIIVLPYLGVFVYLVVRGGSMAQRDLDTARAQEAAVQSYIRHAAGTASPADELERLATLRDQGAIDEAEFQRLKARVVG